MIAVNAADVPLLLDDGKGRIWRVFATPGLYYPIPIEVYRRWHWLGGLQRPLVRVEGFGRTYFKDTAWSRLHEGRKVRAAGSPTRRGCGCRKAT